MIVAATIAIIAWGALAFGAVYRWAYVPLLIACAVVGVAGWFSRPPSPLPRSTRAVLIALMGFLVFTGLQLVPLSSEQLRAISPGTVAFLRNYDLSYVSETSTRPLTIDPPSTGLGLAFAATFVLFLSGLLRALSRARVRALVAAIIMFGVVLAIVGIVQKAVLGDHTYMGMKIYGFWTPESKLVVPFGPYVNRNHFAGWMLMALPLAIGYLCAAFERGASGGRAGWRNRLLWFSSKEGGRAQLTGYAIIIMALSLVMSMSRSGMAAFVVTSFFVVGRLLLVLKTWRSRAAAVALFLILITAPLAWLGPESTVERFSSDSRGSLAMRRHVWADTRSIVRDFPLTGTGLNTFRIATVLYQTGSRDVTFQESHNDYLQLAAEGGLLLGVPAALAILLIAVAVRLRLREDREDRTTYWIRVGAATGLVAIGLQSFVEFSLQMPGNAAFFVVVLALAMHHPDTTVRHARQ